MGTSISFYEDGEHIGYVCFSSWTAERQLRAYNLTYTDCLVWFTEDTREEMIGPRDTDDTYGPYAPDWDVCLARSKKLLALAEAGTRRDYDLHPDRLPALVRLLERCATSPLRDRCTVSVTY